MTDLEALRDGWVGLRKRASFAERQAYLRDLLALNSPAVVALHFELLKDRCHRELYEDARAAFVRRGLEVEGFLVDRAENDDDVIARADALQLLGHLRSSLAAPLARRWRTLDEEEIRKRAVVVLGWTGLAQDVALLGDSAAHDSSPRLRGVAATAMRQIWLRMPDVGEAVLDALRRVIADEGETEALMGQLLCLQTVTKKSFGLKERPSAATASGDVHKAKTRALAFFKTQRQFARR